MCNIIFILFHKYTEDIRVGRRLFHQRGRICSGVRTSASCTKPAHSHALSATAVCSSFFRFWPTTPADGSPLRKTAGALWNSSLATGRKAGAARKRKRSAQPVPAQSPSAVLEVA
ncbi:Hypothetical_protein [Hexamita inflata]|uniref:Hypothetical_protein n=1 Tax=Hexamita inflata TaxID=28002 RepID=A0AA86RKF4_9EUKA|nr:Hypothetical protein HINF_LOCUS65967 [Hexamita inflata]